MQLDAGGPSVWKWRWIYWATVTLVLLLPLVAMQFTSEVNWDLFDFAVAGALLVGTGIGYEIACKVTRSTLYRFIIGVALAAVLFVTWLHLAVGIL